jgi:hypothetical protein
LSIGSTGVGITFLYPNTATYNVIVGSTAYLTPANGFTAAGGIFQVKGSAYISESCTAQKFKTYSDYRIKQNVELLELTKYNTDNLIPVIYNHKATNQPDIGFLAHEVQEYFPFLVEGTKDGQNPQSVNYTGLIGVLTKEIQELKKDNKKIKETLQKFETKLNKL